MTKEELIELKEYLSSLSEEEKIQRNKYLRKIALGEIEGPMTGYPSIDKPWLKYYPENSLDKVVPKMTAYRFVREKCRYRKGTALNYFGKKISYDKLFENIDNVAKSFKKIGIGKGDIITMAMPSTPEMIYVFYALNKIGAITNSIDPRLKEEEILRVMKETDSKCIVGLDMFINDHSEFLYNNNIKTIISLSAVESLMLPMRVLNNLKIKDSKYAIKWNEFIKNGKNYNGIVEERFTPNHPATIVHTGGTTGNPKGVLLTNENFNAMAQIQEISDYNLNEGERALTILPPFIAYCLVNSIHDFIYLGFENILIPNFTPTDFPNLMRKYKPNHVLSGPILWDFFINDKKVDKLDLSFIKSPISGGDALNIELEKKINEFFKSHNCSHTLFQGYGMSEVSSAASYTTDKCYKEGSVGIPFVKNIITVVKPNTTEELPYGEEGEVCIATPTMMKEYYNNKAATDEIVKIHEDGNRYIHTGDIGYVDSDGNVYIKGRIKRMIVRNGNKIFPSTIENIILKDQRVEKCSIVGMNNDKERHVPVCFIKIKPEFIGEEEFIISDINNIIAATMPEFNVPYKYIFINNFPLTEINKIDFRALEERTEKYIDDDRQILFEENQLLRQLK